MTVDKHELLFRLEMKRDAFNMSVSSLNKGIINL